MAQRFCRPLTAQGFCHPHNNRRVTLCQRELQRVKVRLSNTYAFSQRRACRQRARLRPLAPLVVRDRQHRVIPSHD